MKTWTELKNRSDWPGRAHQTMMCDSRRRNEMRYVKDAGWMQGTWQQQIAKVLEEKGF